MKNQIFEFVYDSYEAAFQDCIEINTNINYPVDIWKNRQLEYLTKASVAAPRQESITKVLKVNDINQIVDFGGGSGWLFKYLSGISREVESRIVVETEETISWFREYNQEVSWMKNSSLKDLVVRKNTSILYTNSCIQYLDETKSDYFEILSFPWKFIVLEDIPNIDGPDIWTIQRYYNFCIPYHFFNIKSLVSYIESLGYKMQMQIDYNETYPENWEYRIKNGQSLISPNTPQTLIFSSIYANS